MPVEPIPCDVPPEPQPVTPPCCAPSIASAPLCLPDGTTILAVVRSGCVECGATAEDPAVVGWLDTAGTFTAGALPTDAGPCEAGCVDTVCRQLCDDADGDGQADTTYSELWCIRADGSAELVLTYRDDPSQPYTPLAPVECTYGCPEAETITLCDDSGPFLRRYAWLNGLATHEDFALDGQTAHIVTGTVTNCASQSSGPEPCAAQTTPAATLGLCLADGTPIAVLVTRDCDGAVTQDGWLNLSTGTYSAGDPPAGTMACGSPRSINTTGTFCDVDPASGDVHGLVLIEYTYGADGSVAAVRLVDATTGGTYTPQGEVTTCPAGVAQPERDVVQLCSTAANGTVTVFLRDFARDETGTITGHSDYTLDGAPYMPTGTVGRCSGDCRDCEQVIVCDVPADTTSAKITHVAATGSGASGTLANGVGWSIPGGSQLADFWPIGLYPAPSGGPLTATFSRPVSVTWDAKVGRSGSTVGGLVMPAGSVLVSLGAGHQWNAATRTLTAGPTAGTVTATSPASTFRHDGPVTVLPFSGDGGTPLAAALRQVGNFVVTPATQPFVRITCRGCDGAVTAVTNTLLDGTTAYTPTGTVRVCQPREPEAGVQVIELCDVAADGTSTPFLRALTFPAGGGAPTVKDTRLDGTTPYVPAGTVGVCEPAEPEPCRNTSTTLLCDTASTETITVLDTGARQDADGWTVTSYTNGGCTVVDPVAAVPFAPYWNGVNGGSLSVVADADLGDSCPPWDWATAPVRYVLTKTFDAPQTGEARIVATAFKADGGARVRVNGTDAGLYATYYQDAVNSDTTVPVTAGPNVIEVEVRDIGGPTWLTGRVDVVLTASTQFFRHQVLVCETGAVVSQTDTTLDGQPYTVTGTVGQCQESGSGDGGECCPRRDTEVVQLCDLADDGTSVPFLRSITYTDGTTPSVADTTLDGLTPYTPAGTVGACTEPCRDTSSTLLCDTSAADMITVFDPANRASADGWEVVSFTGANPGFGPEAAMPYPARYGTPFGYPALGARADQNAGSGAGNWHGYDAAPVRWVLRKTFQAPEDGVAVAQSVGFRGDGGARVRINGIDAGMYGQWNQPATSGTAQIPVTAGPNTVEIEVRDTTGINNVVGKLGIALPRTVQFLRHQTVDCATGDVIATRDTTLDGEPYQVAGLVGQCEPVAECCEQPPPETRVDVETALLCVRDQASGQITGQVIAERVYDDQNGDLAEQRLTSLAGDSYTLPAGAELTVCQDAPEGRDVEITPMCVVDNASGGILQRILAEVTYDTATGERLSVRYVDPVTWGPVALPGGTHLDVCPDEQPDPAPDVEVVQLCDLLEGADPVPFLRHLAYLPGASAPTVVDTALDGVTPYALTGTAGACSTRCAVQAVLQECRCDDADGDGIGEVGYVELLAVDCEGKLTSLGTYTSGLTAPYTPVAPVDCAAVDQEEGADPAFGVQARRVELAAGASWTAAVWPTLQSVTAVAHGGTGTVTTADGPSTLHTGEAATWSVGRDDDAALTGPLTVTADTGTVTLSYTIGVKL